MFHADERWKRHAPYNRRLPQANQLFKVHRLKIAPRPAGSFRAPTKLLQSLFPGGPGPRRKTEALFETGLTLRPAAQPAKLANVASIPVLTRLASAVDHGVQRREHMSWCDLIIASRLVICSGLDPAGEQHPKALTRNFEAARDSGRHKRSACFALGTAHAAARPTHSNQIGNIYVI